jgi:electron transfer flavoprotein beta subunit
MELLVCLKQVPDTAAEIKPLADGSALDTSEVPWIINPYDEYALEEAIRIKERLGGGTITALTLGPARAATALRTALAMGADKAVHITGSEFEGCDASATAKALAKAASRSPFDLVLCGKMAVDDYDAQVGILLAQHLGIPHLSCVVRLELSADQKSLAAQCETDRGGEVVECDLPALVTAEKGLNEPRYPAVIAVMKAKQKPIEALSAADLGLSAAEVGTSGSRLHVLGWQLPPQRGECRILEGEPDAAARELLRLLREEAKAI